MQDLKKDRTHVVTNRSGTGLGRFFYTNTMAALPMRNVPFIGAGLESC